ncbi:MAG TPA: bifunctional DNA-formamidopyrimidine glycosylase/DNA-(apurinic or apyrimidinic site) lyase, partial [Patescibacteria group bacterium]|nr:bifunctional DNA-formamidopyrimidine glycosylase/DNA-(apurinic or apyrimidinic site) lyase [Patescibacteria group bacterium]
GLQKYLVGHVIESIDVRLPKIVSGDVGQVEGVKVLDVRRFGKGLVIDLSNSYSIAIHIKMTGQLVYVGEKAKGAKIATEKVGTLPGAHTHVIFHLDDGSNPQSKSDLTLPSPARGEGKAVLYYNDLRRFGWIKILLTKDIPELPFFKELGPEPFKELTLDVFKKIIQSSPKSPIKPLLMDQKKIGGIGNIYANDALYRAKIDPRRKAATLTEKEMKTLFDAIEEVMRKGIEMGGSSEWSYVNVLGEVGGYQKLFLVYGQDGKPCVRCKTLIEKVQFGGRGTYFCSTCQM